MKLNQIPLLIATISVGMLSAPQAEAVKVFILAGQSNMEGKVQRKLIDHQATDAKTSDIFKHLRDGDQWKVRDDVQIKYLAAHGGLTVGYGSGDRTGVELEFGTVLGDKFEEPVLLIKTAWGGHSLYKLFRSPSAGMPAERIEVVQESPPEKAANINRVFFTYSSSESLVIFQ